MRLPWLQQALKPLTAADEAYILEIIFRSVCE